MTPSLFNCNLLLAAGTTPIAAGQNPATWMLEVTGGSMAMVTAANSVDWPAVYAASSLAAANAAECERLVAEGLEAGVQLKLTSLYAQPLSVQVCNKRVRLTSRIVLLLHARCYG